MPFLEILNNYNSFDFEKYFETIESSSVLRSIQKDDLTETDFLSLLSEKAVPFIEQVAKKANKITLRNFGNSIFIYAPLYISNFCTNECVYCGFNRTSKIERKRLSIEELINEAKVISSTGIRHILILTGESREITPVSYIKECVEALKPFFSSISIEIYPLETSEYAQLVSSGVDGLAVYQETYDEPLYREYHIRGPKSDFYYRLETPERACNTELRSVNIGALYGLSDFRKETFLLGLHAKYLQDKFPEKEIGVSFPRIKSEGLEFIPRQKVTDANIVQMITAIRLFLPRIGITITTREANEFRKNLIGLGVTRFSAGSKTDVGGYSRQNDKNGQFKISDTSSVEEVKAMISEKGYQPVMKDW